MQLPMFSSQILESFDVSSKDPFRLDDDGEKCVEIIKNELNRTVSEL